MRVPTRAREISFTFTPRRVYRPLWSGDGGVDSLAANVTPAPEPMPFAAAVNRASSFAPNRLFRSRRLPLVGKETTSNKSCGSAGARSGGNGGGERAVHIGTTKG